MDVRRHGSKAPQAAPNCRPTEDMCLRLCMSGEWCGGFGILELFFRHRPICCAIADNLSRAVGRQMRVTQTNYFSPPSCGLGSAYETSATRGGEGAGRRVAVVLCPFAPEARFRTQCYCLVRLKQLCSEHWNLLSDP